MWNNFGHIIGTVVSLLIIAPLICGSIVVAISRANKRLSISIGGFYGQVVLGCLGIMIHELSHLIMALAFGHQIERVSLLHIPNPHDPNDRGLGYVSHVWNDDNLYQKIGNVFIGIAPVVGCALTMLLSTRFLVPEIYNRWVSAAGGSQVIGSTTPWWHFVLWLILMVNISIGGFDLSAADLQNSRQGLVALGIFLIIGSAILSLVTDARTISDQLFQFVHPLILTLGFAIVVNVALWLVLRLIVYLKQR